VECGWRCLAGLGAWRVCWGALKGELFRCCYSNGGWGGALLNIYVLVFLFRNGFPLSFTGVHSVCGFIITPRSARYEVHESVKEDPCLCAIWRCVGQGNSNHTAWRTLHPSSGVSDHGVRISWTLGSCNICKVVTASYD